jgi:competence protein ComEA
MNRACFAFIIACGLLAGADHMVAASQQPQRQEAAPPAEKAATPQTNLNTADAPTLQKLPGVGPAMAARILEYREKNGGFKKIEDLMNVKGVGEKTFLKLKPLITVTPPKSNG